MTDSSQPDDIASVRYEVRAHMTAVSQMMKEHVAADAVSLGALNAKMDSHAAMMAQVKEILDSFSLAGKISKIILLWAAMLGGAVVAIVNGWHAITGQK